MKTILIILTAILASGSAIITDQEARKDNDQQDRKLQLLEKLESGKTIAADEIRSFFGDRHEHGSDFHPECPLLISHDEMDMIRESFNIEPGSLLKELDELKHSDEFIKAMDELKRGSEELRREMEKMMDEIRKSGRRSGEGEIV